jgi:hypothetical protein
MALAPMPTALPIDNREAVDNAKRSYRHSAMLLGQELKNLAVTQNGNAGGGSFESSPAWPLVYLVNTVPCG